MVDIAYKFCWNRPLLLFEEKIQILSVSLQVLLKQAFTAVLPVFEEMMQILSASLKVFLKQVFTAVGREDTDLICWLISFLKQGLYCSLKRRFRFYLLTVQFFNSCHLALSHRLHCTS